MLRPDQVWVWSDVLRTRFIVLDLVLYICGAFITWKVLLDNNESRVYSGSNQTDGDLEGQEVEEILIKQEEQHQGWANGTSNFNWNGTNNGRPNGYQINRKESLHFTVLYSMYES